MKKEEECLLLRSASSLRQLSAGTTIEVPETAYDVIGLTIAPAAIHRRSRHRKVATPVRGDPRDRQDARGNARAVGQRQMPVAWRTMGASAAAAARAIAARSERRPRGVEDGDAQYGAGASCRCSVPIRRRKSMYAVVQVMKTCWPLSTVCAGFVVDERVGLAAGPGPPFEERDRWPEVRESRSRKRGPARPAP